MNTLKDNKLRKLFTKAGKYRGPRKIDFAQVKQNINGIKNFILTWSQKHGIPDAVLLEWKINVIELEYNRITILKVQNTKNHQTVTSLLKTTVLRNNLQHIHDQFVVALIDKANGNVAFVCEHFFVEV